jgi:hypothetical protein
VALLHAQQSTVQETRAARDANASACCCCHTGNPAAAAGGLPLLAYDVVYASLLAEQGLLREALAYVSAIQVQSKLSHE